MTVSRIAIYPGTFDPVTNGHVDIIKRALGVADKLIIAVAEDSPKTPIFTLKERASLIDEAARVFAKTDHKRIEVQKFSGLLVDFARKHKAKVLIRGLRAISDFEYEFQMAHMNAKLNSDIQTIFLPASEQTHFISSRFVKEIARLGGDVTELVPKNVAEAIKKKYK
ncbi:MAG: pantetheine-phosphate adenylyltransferase [Proteobacteria bacterium]|nr:pantetheine-phosphate adenylyltransferase [Pseudomonadota bacterium]